MGLGPLSQLPTHPTQEPTNSLRFVFTVSIEILTAHISGAHRVCGAPL